MEICEKTLTCHQIPAAKPHVYIITSLFILKPYLFVCFTPNIGLHLLCYYCIHIVYNIYTAVITIHYAFLQNKVICNN